MRLLMLTVYKPIFDGKVYDCSNNGVSSKKDIYVECSTGNFDLSDIRENGTLLELRVRGDYSYLTPANSKEREFQMGGNYAGSCDARFRSISPNGQPLPIHDRID